MTEDEQSFEDWILATTGQPYHEWLYDRKQEALKAAEEKAVAEEEEIRQQIARAEARRQADAEMLRAVVERAEVEAYRRDAAIQRVDAKLAALPAWANRGNGFYEIQTELRNRDELIEYEMQIGYNTGRYA